MLKGISLTDLARKIEANRELKLDYIAETNALEMKVMEDGQPILDMGGDHKFGIMRTAHDQIGDRTGIPAKYYDRMLASAPELLAHNVNTWFRQSPKKNMIRTLGGDARAFLSNRYQRIENEEIAAAALPVLRELKVQVVSAEVTDRRMYIHFTVPTVQGEVKKGDIVQAGGIISNSEIGAGAASVSGLLWRLICLNGMKTTDKFRQAHIGRRVEDSEELWADDTRQADDRAVLLKVRDMVKAVVDEARFRVNLDKMRGLAEIKIANRPEKAVEVLTSKMNLSDTEGSMLLAALVDGMDMSAWGLVNAVTAQAHKAKNYDRAVELEAIGGALLELPKSEWKNIVTAE